MTDLWVCGACYGLREGSGGRQLCRCASAEQHKTAADAAYREAGEHWTRVAEICRCCAAELVDAQTKWSKWFCFQCLPLVDELNRGCGRCAIPVGWHSIVNGVYAPANRCRTLTGATGVADELTAFFRESGGVYEWGRRTVERHWLRVGLPPGTDVPADDYLRAVRSGAGIDVVALFEELVAARGIPTHWREFADLPLELVWEGQTQDGGCFVAAEETIWEYPDGEDDYADLRLVVTRAAAEGWAWEVILSEEAAGPRTPHLASGVSSSLEYAKKDCEAATQVIIREQEAHAGNKESFLPRPPEDLP